MSAELSLNLIILPIILIAPPIATVAPALKSIIRDANVLNEPGLRDST